MKRVILIASFVLVCGCQNEEPMTVETVSEGVALAEGANDMEPESVTELADMTISETAGPSLLESAEFRVSGEEKIAAEEGRVALQAGEALELVVRIRQVPEGLAAWVHWIGPDDQQVSKEQKTVPEDGVVSFTVDTGGWAEGDYSAEIYIGGDLVDVKELRLTTE